MPSSSRRRRRRGARIGVRDLNVAGGLFGLLAAGGVALYVRAWYIREHDRIWVVLHWAIPTTIAVVVLAVALLARHAIKEHTRTSRRLARQRTMAQRAVRSAEAASRPEVEVELPPREYLYRVWGHWLDQDTGTWYEDVLLYVGRSIDFMQRRRQHDVDSWWVPNAVRSAEQYLDSYVDERGLVVSAHDLVIAAERDAIRAEGPKHNIVHNGELGRRERELRARIRASRAA